MHVATAYTLGCLVRPPADPVLLLRTSASGLSSQCALWVLVWKFMIAIALCALLPRSHGGHAACGQESAAGGKLLSQDQGYRLGVA